MGAESSLTSLISVITCCCLQAPAELGFEDRLSVEDSLMVLDQVRAADAGQFKITDILGFTVSSIHLEIQRKGWRVCTGQLCALPLVRLLQQQTAVI